MSNTQHSVQEMYRKGNARRNQSRWYQKAFYFVDNLHENVLRNVYSLDLNYDMEPKIQGRVHSGKLRITVQTQVEVGSNISKTSASVSSGFPNTRKLMKARGRRPSAFIVFECLETLMKHEPRVFEIASQTCIMNQEQ